MLAIVHCLMLSLVLIASESLKMFCEDSSCSSCTDGYSFKSKSCLSLCPTGYSVTTSPSRKCLESDSLQVFVVKFYQQMDYEATSIMGFSHPDALKFNDAFKATPIPAVSRGFYFTSTSKLVFKDYVLLSPDLALHLCVLVKHIGTIFEVIGNNVPFFKLEADENNLIASIYLTGEQGNSTKQIYLAYNNVVWKSGKILIQSTFDSITFELYDSKETFIFYDFRAQIETAKFYFGSLASASFLGFIYQADLYNFLFMDYYIMYPFSTCDYSHYYSGYDCYQCSCQIWPFCTRSSCNACYSSLCSACTGPFMDNCLSCSNSNNPPNCSVGKNCITGNEFSCSDCNTNFQKIDGLCIVNPFNYNENSLDIPIIDLKFDKIQKFYSGIFQSGANSGTYAPFNNPEEDDPIPVKSRGIYFNQKSYLISTQEVSLNYKFTIAT